MTVKKVSADAGIFPKKGRTEEARQAGKVGNPLLSRCDFSL
jgi:hypothetical protein